MGLTLEERLAHAFSFRAPLVLAGSGNALRLFNGFYEGVPGLAVDLYGSTLVVHDLAKTPDQTTSNLCVSWYRQAIPWLQCVVIKTRHSPNIHERIGVITFGTAADEVIVENGIRYRINLLMNQDASFYLDTRYLREWLFYNARGKHVLNTFAYTGSLGLAALAGGAEKVVQLDLNQRYMHLATEGCALNELLAAHLKTMVMDFFPAIAQLKKSKTLFDIIILDPPFFSSTQSGKVDLNQGMVRLINKVRPLLRNGGQLVCINNALFLSGQEMMNSLQSLCNDGYVTIGNRIDVPQDFYCPSDHSIENPVALPSDPSPFNHSTKIIILTINRKEQ